MNADNLTISEKNIRKSAYRVSRNNEISDFYKTMAEEQNSETFQNRSEAVKQCYRFWDVDYYRQQRIKDVKRITRCRDKFCCNCQNSEARKREGKYTVVLDELRKRFDIYHVVLTVPNCKGNALSSTLDAMYAKFPYLIQYLQGKRKANDINFAKFGFVAAVRALEVTHKRISYDIEYHPHFHCLFLFRKGLDKERRNKNEFSFSNGKFRRNFSDNEIFFQKIWYLLYNGNRLTKSALSNLKQGYSVTMDIPEKGHYHQVFKYVLGGNFKKGEPLFDYEVFKTLYNALYRRKMIQGYGILNKYKFDEDISDAEIDEIYSAIIAELQAVETAEPQTMKIEEVIAELDEGKGIRYISRNSIRRELAAAAENKND